MIYAISVREVVTSVPLEPDADPPQREGSFGRYWIWGGGDRSRYLMYRLLPEGRRGRLESETAVNGNRISWFHPDANVTDVMKRPSPDWPAGPDANGYPGFSPFSDPGAQLRARVEEGTLRVTGRTTVRGRTAYRLVSKARRDPQEGVLRESVTYLVDARTYLPLEIRSRSLGDFGRVDPRWGAASSFAGGPSTCAMSASRSRVGTARCCGCAPTRAPACVARDHAVKIPWHPGTLVARVPGVGTPTLRVPSELHTDGGRQHESQASR